MAEHGTQLHPELDRLAERAAGALDVDAAAAIDRHLSSCPTCRVEIERLRRFASLDADDELAAEADWPRAEVALERKFHEEIMKEIGQEIEPAAAPPTSGRVLTLPSRFRRPPRLRWSLGGAPSRWWVIPAAAAAILVLVLLGLPARRGPEGPPDLTGPPRGGGPISREITLDLPVGDLKEPPRQFAWRAEKRFDSYAFEIVTPELERVYRQTGIGVTAFTPPDTLLGLLAPGRTYLWSVQGYRGLTVSAVSAHAWFKMPRGSPEG